jgi:hypothetical protein
MAFRFPRRTSLQAHRRQVRRAAARLIACRRDVRQQRRRIGDLLHARLTSQEALILTFDAGLTLGMLSPQGKRGEPAADRRPPTQNQALRATLRLARRIAIRQAMALLAP